MNKEKLFNRYLHGEMDSSEFAAFKIQLDNDESLRQDFRIHEAMYNDRAQRIKEVIQQNDKRIQQPSNDPENKNPQASFGRIIRRVAAVFIFGVASYFIAQQLDLFTLTQPSLSLSYLSDRHLPPPVSMGKESINDPWALAREAYRSNKFEISIKQINLIENPTAEQIFYLALSYLYLDNPDYESTEKLLENILLNQNTQLKEQALWYSSLTAIQLGSSQKAIQNLEQLITLRSWKYKEAQHLLAEIKK